MMNDSIYFPLVPAVLVDGWHGATVNWTVADRIAGAGRRNG